MYKVIYKYSVYAYINTLFKHNILMYVYSVCMVCIYYLCIYLLYLLHHFRDIEDAERAQQNTAVYQRNLVHDRNYKKNTHQQQEEEESEYDDSELDSSGQDWNQEEEEEEGGEVLTAIEIQRLSQGKYKQKLIDDYDQVNIGTSIENSQDKESAEVKIKPSKPSDFTTEELFYTISNNRNEINLSQLKRWVYIRELRQAGSLTIPILQQIFQKAGGHRGYLNIDQFELFLEIFADTLGLVDEDDYISDTNGNNNIPYYIDDYKSSSSSNNNEIETTIQNSDLVSVKTASELSSSTIPSDNLSIQTLFTHITQKKTHLSYANLLQRWKVFSDLVAVDSKLAKKLRQSFAHCAKTSTLRGKMDEKGFIVYVNDHIRPAAALALSKQCTSSDSSTGSGSSNSGDGSNIKKVSIYVVVIYL